MPNPLRYHISDLRQLKECRSNRSQDLSIKVTRFIQDKRFGGTRVQVVHETFGVVFAYTFQACGTMIEPYGELDEIRITTLLSELRKYGFIVTYDPVSHLPGDELELLATLNRLGFDKIRILPIYKDRNKKEDEIKTIVTLFNVAQNPKWIDNRYCAFQDEYDRALNEGSAFNVSAISKKRHYDWTWLTGFVADIDDVLRDNAGILER